MDIVASMRRGAATGRAIRAAALAALPLLLFGLAGAVATSPMARGGCSGSCGNISIPYPFGVEAGCYHPGFNLTCNNSHTPPRLFLGGGSGGTSLQVLEISIPNGTVRINSPRISFDDAIDEVPDVEWGAGLRDDGPYSVSEYTNSMVVLGCNVQINLLKKDNNNSFLVGSCTPVCPALSEGAIPANFGRCSGVMCCLSAVSLGYPSYHVQLHRLNDSVYPSAFYIAEPGFNYTLDMFVGMGPYSPDDDDGGLPLPAVLDWAISNHSACPSDENETANMSSAPECRSDHSYCRKSSTVSVGYRGYRCYCGYGYQGNPYIPGGCQDVDECKLPGTYPCYGDCNNTQGGYQCDCPPGFAGKASTPNGCKDIDECLHPGAYNCYGICKNFPGSFHCQCPNGTYGDPSTKGGCNTIYKSTFTGPVIALVVGSGSILLLLALAAPFIARKIKLHKTKKLKEKRFKQNHGLLLQQLISQRADIGERMLITLREVEKATDNFDKTREVGGGGHGTVYKGILDLHVVAIKKSKIVVQREIDEFINEVAILSQINHRNVVKLLGCCLETEVPLLVYEFISNGTLYQHLHVEGAISLSWEDRLRITQEVARALSYLHSAASMPIFHRDIKSSNILLDDNLTSKVSDFGASRYIPIDQSGVTTAIQGTIGYLDPMYYYTGRLTDKSDVFSFGVLVIELLTRKKPFIYRSNDGDSLVSHFSSLFTEGKLVDIIDPQVIEEDDGDVQEVAALAVTCTKLKGEDRPTMREVEITLENLQVRRAPRNTTSTNIDHIPAPGTSQEASRQYSMEWEMMLSAKYPR